MEVEIICSFCSACVFIFTTFALTFEPMGNSPCPALKSVLVEFTKTSQHNFAPLADIEHASKDRSKDEASNKSLLSTETKCA